MTDNMKAGESSLFLPFALGKLNLPNRLVMAPMTRYFSPGYVPSELAPAYYARRVEGGVGLVITEATIVDEPHATAYEDVPGMFEGEPAQAWGRVVDAVHRAGGGIFSQLWHTGAIRKPGVGPDPDLPAISPSGLLMPGVSSGRAMEEADIGRVIEAFARGAALAVEIGFDGVEIHGAHGYLVDQFLWEGTNQRQDRYGGNLAARVSFARELVSAVRDAMGPDPVLSFRFSQWKQQDYEARLAHTPAELAGLLVPLSEAGVDMFHASTRRFWEPEFRGSSLNLAGWAKKITGKPAITVGSVCLASDFLNDSGTYETMMREFELTATANQEELLEGVGELMSASSGAGGMRDLEERLAAGEFDLVAAGRALLANPELPKMIHERRLDDLRPYSAELLAELA